MTHAVTRLRLKSSKTLGLPRKRFRRGFGQHFLQASQATVEPRYLISYGAMNEVAVFTGSAGTRIQRGQQVVVETDRGVEVGNLLGEAGIDNSVSEETNGDDQPPDATKWRFLRLLETEDEQDLANNVDRGKEEFEVWRRRLAKMSMPVELVDLEYLLSGDTVVLYVLAVEGSDFSAVTETLSKIVGKRLLFERFGDDPAARRSGGCSGNCSCGRE